MNWIKSSSIGTRIYLVVLLLSVVAVAVGGSAAYALFLFKEQIAAIDMASRRAVVGERVNGMINAVVMDSRGVYMSRDREGAERFGKPLLNSLSRIEALMREWRGLIEPRHEADFARAEAFAREFVTFRIELVRRGVENGGPAARDFADNEANRSNRQAFNDEISRLADQNNVEIAAMRADIEAFNDRLVLIVVIGGLTGVGVGLLLSLLIVRRSIVRPLRSIISVMTRLAGGDRQFETPALDQGDEIGAMARAVEVFKGNSQRNEEMALAISMREERARLAAAEEDLRLARAEVEQLIHASTIGEMAASIAHEIDQPIGAIIINCDASLRWLAVEPPNLDRAREALQRTIRDAHRANDVISRVRSLVRKDRVDVSALSVNDLIGDVLAFTRNEQEQGGIVVETDLSEKLPEVCGDPIQLQQVMINLIRNAIDAMRGVSDRARRLHMRSGIDESGKVVINVEDTGVGIEQDALDRLYQPFFTTKQGGMGMGLTISRSIVEAHGGLMGARVRPGGGTVFWFTLPPAREAA